MQRRVPFIWLAEFRTLGLVFLTLAGKIQRCHDKPAREKQHETAAEEA
jgi:hypothetical protein